MLPPIIVFEQDGTLAETKQPLSTHTAELIGELLKLTKVAVISGESIRTLEDGVSALMPPEALNPNLYLLPTNGSELYTFQHGERITLFADPFSPQDVERIVSAMEAAARETGLIDMSAPSYGPRIENRGSLVALSALGQQAPADLKRAWDPDYSKRLRLRECVALLLSDCQVKWGGLTTIDVTRPDGDKASGIRRLSEHLRIPVRDMVYVGNNVAPGGHNEVVKTSNIRTVEIENPHDADRFIEMLLRQRPGA